MRTAIVIGTYGTPQFVHLGLASLRRHVSGEPVLIHDDYSNRRAELVSLANQYGAEFFRTTKRLGHSCGDLSSVIVGLRWAFSLNADVLVKFSRRCIPCYDWRAGLEATLRLTGYHTFCPGMSPPETHAVAFDCRWWADRGLARLERIMAEGGGQLEQVLLRIAPPANWPRMERPHVLWREHSAAGEYEKESRSLGLTYSEADFSDEKNLPYLW